MVIPHKGDYDFHSRSGMQLRIKNLENTVADFKSGEAYVKEKNRADKWRKKYEQEVAARRRDKLKADKEQERAVRKVQRLVDERDEELEKKDAEIEALKQLVQTLTAERDEANSRAEDTLEQNAALKDRLGLNHTNSNIPSSKDPIGAPTKKSKKKRHNYNSRKPSGKKPGAQPGHEHHGRKFIEATEPPVYLNDRPACIAGEDDWELKGYREHLSVGVRLIAMVTPYRAAIWKNKRTGEIVKTPFPPGLENEINYDPSVKALAVMLTHNGNMAIRKVKEVLYEASDGVLDVSVGWIAERNREFSIKSEDEQLEAFRTVFKADWQGVDATGTRNNGKNEAIGIAHCPDAAYFAHNKSKGDALMEKLPCSPKLGCESDIVSDRESAMQKCGKEHQDCLGHYDRELQRIIEMEPDKKWASEMSDLFVMFMHLSTEWRNGDGETGPSDEQVKEYEEAFDQLIVKGTQEYIKNPPSKYFLNGYNLMRTLEERRENVLLFLHKPWIPNTNNVSEGYMKKHKRALHARMTFRSGQSIDDHCAYMTVSETWKLNDKSVFKGMVDVFGRPGYTKAH